MSRQVSFRPQSTVVGPPKISHGSIELSPIQRCCAFYALAAILLRGVVDAYRFDDPLDEAPELGEHEEAPDHQAETEDERQTCKKGEEKNN